MRNIFLLLICMGSLAFSFVHVSGDQIIDDQGKALTLRGVALENGMFSAWDEAQRQSIMIEDSQTVNWSIQEADIREIKQQGFNVVRYCVNYERFSPQNPWREQNWQIFAEQLKWCKKYGVYLIFNLHIPPGRSNVIRTKDDSIFESDKYWADFESFWTELLKLYKNEKIIAGWEFFNEPQIPLAMTEDVWHRRVEGFLQKMRALDQQHIFFVCYPHCRVQAIAEDGEHQINWGFLPFHKYTDNNIVYVAHFYEPINFSHQGYAPDIFPGVRYPLSAFIYKNYLSSTDALPQTKTERDWRFYQSELISVPASADYGLPYLAAAKDAGSVYFDVIKIYEVAENGSRKLLDLPNPSFTPYLPDYPSENGLLFDIDKALYWTTYYTDKYADPPTEKRTPYFKYITSAGFDDNYCLMINNPEQEIANWQTDPLQFCVKPKPGCKYQIEGWVRSAEPEAGHIGLSWYQGEPVQYDKKFLEKSISEKYLSFSKKYKVPLIVTEFGSIGFGPMESRLRWTKDILDIFKQNKVHYTYWCWSQKHGWGFDFGLILKDPYNNHKEYYRYKKLIKLLSPNILY